MGSEDANYGALGLCRWDTVEKRPVCIQRSMLQVIHADPQLLLVHIAIPSFPLLVAVAHAPHSGKGKHIQLHWWRKLQQHLTQHACGNSIVFLIDANVQATYDPPHVGTLGSSEDSEIAEAFAHILRTQELQLTNTIEAIHNGKITTWTSNDGTTSTCIDYIAIPLQWTGFSLHSYIDDMLDSGAGGIDHSAVCLQVAGAIVAKSRPDRRRTFDRNKIANATDAQRQDFYRAWPVIPWTTHPRHMRICSIRKSTRG